MLIAVDIGNTRIKLGRFAAADADCQQAALGGVLPIAGPPLPEPIETLSLAPPVGPGSANADALAAWLADDPSSDPEDKPTTAWAVASVNRPVEIELLPLFDAATLTPITSDRVPIATRVAEPARVGVDRLLAGLAANRLRRDDRAAVVVDLGTAITVDLIAADGVFEGGAILPGIGMASRALHEQTDALPNSGLTELDASPDAVGRSTDEAINAGLFWGAVGAVRELIARQSDRLTQPPQVFLTGGAAPSVARLLGGPDTTVRYVPHLVLSGIALAAGGTR